MRRARLLFLVLILPSIARPGVAAHSLHFPHEAVGTVLIRPEGEAEFRALNVYASKPEFRGDEPNPSITDAGLASFASCPRLEHLDVTGSQLTDAGLKRLTVDCPQLRRLAIDDTSVTLKGLRHIGSLSRLERLRCYGINIDDSAVEHFQSLKKLRGIVGDVEVGNTGAMALAALPNLEELSLSGKCDDKCMASIAAMPSLKELSIQHTKVADAGFALLAGSPTLERVQITGNQITTRCIETLATMPRLKRVGLMNVGPRADNEPNWKGLEQLGFLEQELWLVHCPPLDPEDFAKFANFRNLAMLRIAGGRTLTDDDLRSLRALDRLEYLEITCSVATDRGVEAIGSLPSLERLTINCLATENGLDSLARSRRLRYLRIASPELTDEIAQRVHARRPQLVIRLTEFRLGTAKVSRSISGSDRFWRLGSKEERATLNLLEGKLAPPIAVSSWLNVDRDFDLDKLRGSVVLVEFWGTWCGACLVLSD